MKNDVKILATPVSEKKAPADTEEKDKDKDKGTTAVKEGGSCPKQPMIVLLALCVCTFVYISGSSLGLDSNTQKMVIFTTVALFIAGCVSINATSSSCPARTVDSSETKSCPFASSTTATSAGRGEVELHTIKNIDQLVLNHGSSASDNDFMSVSAVDFVYLAEFYLHANQLSFCVSSNR